jgi:hypothetical protein
LTRRRDRRARQLSPDDPLARDDLPVVWAEGVVAERVAIRDLPRTEPRLVEAAWWACRELGTPPCSPERLVRHRWPDPELDAALVKDPDKADPRLADLLRAYGGEIVHQVFQPDRLPETLRNPVTDRLPWVWTAARLEALRAFVAARHGFALPADDKYLRQWIREALSARAAFLDRRPLCRCGQDPVEQGAELCSFCLAGNREGGP